MSADAVEAARLEQRLRELDAEIHIERELEAWRLHKRLRASGIVVALDTLRPLRRSELEYQRPSRSIAKGKAGTLTRPSGRITGIR